LLIWLDITLKLIVFSRFKIVLLKPDYAVLCKIYLRKRLSKPEYAAENKALLRVIGEFASEISVVSTNSRLGVNVKIM